MKLQGIIVAAIWVVGFLLAGSPALAQGDSVKPSPLPSQGTISPSGKFIPAQPGGMTNVPPPPKTPAEAVAALKKGLNVRQTGSNTFAIGRVEFDRFQRSVTVPIRVTIRSQVIEYALVTEQGKAYESLFTTEASPTDLQLAFLLLGIEPIAITGELRTPEKVPASNAVRIEVNWHTNGPPAGVSVSDLIVLAKSPADPSRPLGVEPWLYNGSSIDQWGFGAQREGSIIALIRDPSALVNNPAADRDNDSLHWPNQKLLPPEGTRATLTFRLPAPPSPTARPAPPWVTPITPLSTNAY